MTRSLFLCCAVLCAALTLVGCDQGRQRPGQVDVRVLNVAPGFEELRFRREQTTPSTFAFQNAQAFTYDADTYDFTVDERSLLANVPGRSWTFAETFRENQGYTLVILEDAGEIRHALLEYEKPAATSAQIVALHAGGGLPAMDLYLAAPGAGIAGTAARGTLNPFGKLAAQSLATGDYEIWLTAAGNPNNVLLRSTTINLAAAQTAAIIVTPEAGQGTAALSVVLLQADPFVIYDRNATAELRVINGVADGQPRDVALNNQFTPPAFSAVPYATITPFAAIPVGSAQPFNVTPAGNPGVLEINSAISSLPSERYTVLFGGTPGSLLYIVVPEDRRRLPREAKLRFYNAAAQFTGALDFVLLAAGTSPTDALADASIAVPGSTAFVPRATGQYDLYVRRTGTSTIVSGPTRLSLTAGGIYGVLAINGPDSATASLVMFDDVP